MKIKIVVLLLIALSFLQSCTQTVPKVVNDAFMKKFVAAKDIEWKKRPQQDWMATFYMKKFHYMTAIYSPAGKFESYETEIYDEDIPDSLINKINSKYPRATIFDVFEKNMELTTEYIFEIENDGQLFGIYFIDNGTSTIIPPDDYRFTSRIHIEND